MDYMRYIFDVASNTTKISSDINSDALRIIEEQNRVIQACKTSMLNAVKVAAVMAEAVKLVEEGVLDASDVSNYVNTALVNNTAKYAALKEETYNSSPGSIVEEKNSKDVKVDPLTKTLREIGER